VTDADDGSGQLTTTTAAARITKRPVNFVNPPHLADISNPTGETAYSLNWSHAEKTVRLSHYVIQETINPTVLLTDNAENDITALWTSNGFWKSDDQYRHSGTLSYWSDNGYNANLRNTTLALTSDVLVPSAATDARFSFYSRYHNFIFDDGFIEISTDSGATWQPLRRLYADPVPPPLHERMQFHEFDLSAYVGQAIRVRFRFDTTEGSVPGGAPGWWIDDISITAGTWHEINTVEPNANTYDVEDRMPGHYGYRVRGVFADGSVTGWSNLVETTVIQEPPPANDSGPRINGGGWLLRTDGAKINFSVNAHQEVDGTLVGHLNINDKAAGVKINLTGITYLGELTSTCSNVSAGASSLEIQGSGTYNGEAATFRACAQDGGEPGVGQDRLFLTCTSGCSYLTGESGNSDELHGGNLQIDSGDLAGGQNGGGGGAAAPAVITLGDPLLTQGVPGVLQLFTITVYDGEQVPLAGVIVTLTRVNAGGTTNTFIGETDANGLAFFTVTHGFQAASYYATADEIDSNWIHITPLLP
jgi:hypothetical protein